MSATRTAVVDGIPTLMKVCDDCGREGVATVDSSSFFYVNSRHPDGSPRSWVRRCKKCETRRILKRHAENRDEINAKRRQRYADRRATDLNFVENLRKRSREQARRDRQDPVRYEVIRKRTRAYQQRVREERGDEVRARARENYALRRHRQGKALRLASAVPRADDGQMPRMAAEPFRWWLETYREHREIETLTALADELNMTLRRVRSVLSSEYRQVQVDVVDTALTSAVEVMTLAGRSILTVDDLDSLEHG